jgi:predicted DNA-binding ribbon-helix-helix protein
MATLTIHLPDDVHERLRQLAKSRKLSVNKLIEELVDRSAGRIRCRNTIRVRAARGNPEAGLHLWDRLEKAG